MIFSELYSAYYHTVAEILKHATDHAVGKEELRTIIKETEIVIRILSFGPMIKVVAPAHFENLIKERLIKQKSCGL